VWNNPSSSITRRLMWIFAGVLLLSVGGAFALRDLLGDGASAEQRWTADTVIALVTMGWLTVGIGLHFSILVPLRKTMQTVRALDNGVDSRLTLRRDEIGEIARMLARLRETLERLNRLAYSDGITHLANRARFDEAIAEEIGRSAGGAPGFAVLFIDLNHFKSINDGFGYAFGDRYLTAVASRLRRVTPPNRLLCRYGGDKFAVLLRFERGLDINRLSLYTEASAAASALLRTMSEPLKFEGHSLTPYVSIGIALYPHDGDTADAVLSAADSALHSAKYSRDGIRFASRGVIDEVRNAVLLAGDIRRGLDAGEFRPYYQPIVNVDTGMVVGAEALIRWVHPTEGLVLPDSFLGVAQNTGLFELITDVMLEKAFADAAGWRRAGLDIKLAVNISAHQLRPGIIERIREQLARAQLEAEAVELEIVETVILERPDEAAVLLGQLRELGISIGLDDFGTGYSSLSLLQRLPLDKIKIPQNFVGNLGQTREADEIVVATVALARSLGYSLVAEGVDDRSQMNQLRALRCPLQQGFLFSPALPLEAFVEWARSDTSHQLRAERFD
jgi:diguanylate cyclase (GGDEF)-like protein